MLFVTAQIVIATVLLSVVAVVVPGFRATWSAPMGFESAGVLTFRIAPNLREYADETRREHLFESMANATGNAAFSRYVPFSGGSSTTFRVRDELRASLPSADLNSVSPNYFATLRIRMTAGRPFDSRDRREAPLAAIVNETLVSRYLAGKNPIGQHIRLTALNNRDAEIVGVVAEVRQNSDPRPGFPQIYVPFAQNTPDSAYFTVRAPLTALPGIRRRLAAIDPLQPVFDARTLDDRIYDFFVPFREISGLLLWFGLLTLILAAVGVYGVVSFSVAQQTREIGIRSALGANRARLLRMFLKQGFVMLAAGLAPGIAASYFVSFGLRSMLFEDASANRMQALTATALIVMCAVLAATLIPARKAMSIDPLKAIRYE
jgi:predicted permease